MRIGIRHKLLFLFLLPVVAIIAVFSVSAYLAERKSIREEIDKRGAVLTAIFTQMAVPYVFEMDYVTVQDNAAALVGDAGIVSIAVTDLDGNILIDTDSRKRESVFADDFHLRALERNSLVRREIESDAGPALEFVSPLTSLGKAVYLVRMEISLKPLRSRLVQSAWNILLLSSCLVLTAAVMAFFLSRMTAGSIKALSQGAREIARGNFSHKLHIGADDEIGDLAKSFNEMGERLKESFDRIKRQHREIELKMELLERTEKLRLEKCRAELASRAKSEFLANMSHEMRTPLNAVIGLVSLTLKTNPTPRQREYLEKVRSSAGLLLSIVNDVLDFSKIEAGKLVLENKAFQLDGVLDGLYDIFAENASEKNLEFFIAVEDDVPRSLKGDPLRLGQVLTNLTGNALKFTEKGDISVRAVELERDETRSLLRFSVRDTGIGIEKSELGRIFSPFTQADESTTRRFGGTGLGLTICARLAELMGGRLWAESLPGEGSVFHCEAWFERNTKALEKQLRLPESFQGMAALVVDHEKTAREFLVRSLREFGLNAMSASSGPAALKGLEKVPSPLKYGLVVVDQKLPGMDCVELAKKIRDRDRLSKIAVIMVTEYGREAFLRRTDRGVEVDAFVFRPVRKRQLYKAVSNVLKTAESEDDASSCRVLEGVRVLLVEDNLINRQVAAEILTGAGARVTAAGNGREALDILFSGDNETGGDAPDRFDVILMDVQMPEMDGLEAARIIRSRGMNTPVVAVTAHALKINRRACLDAGMNDFISKPFEPDGLCKAIAGRIEK